MSYALLFDIFALAIFLNFQGSSEKMYDAYISRVDLIELDPNYVANYNVYIHRLNRNSPYTFTANFTSLYPVYDNVSIHIIGFERSNTQEYKEGAFVIKNKFCQWMNTDKIIYPIARHYSPTLPKHCPIVGQILIKDLVNRSEMLPSFLPLTDTKLEFHFLKTITKETLLKGNLYFTVVERAAKKSKKN